MKIKFSVIGNAQSVNSIWKRRNNGGVFLNDSARKWLEVVKWTAKVSLREQNIEVPKFHIWSVWVEYYFSDKRKRDAHNYEKLILDALEGIIYENDTQVWKWGGERKYGEPKVIITAEPLYEMPGLRDTNEKTRRRHA